jgi:hypothetical protein
MPVLVRRIPWTLRLRPEAFGSLAVLVILLSTAPAKADVIPTVAFNPTSMNVAPGGTGTVELDLVNTGPSIDLAAFNINVDASSTDLSFTGGSTSTTYSYILLTNSFGATVTNPSGPATVQLNDIAASMLNMPPDGQMVGDGTFGLAVFTFSVSPSAVLGSTINLTIDPATSFYDPTITIIPVDTTATATITIASVPEPSALFMTGTALLAGLGLWVQRRWASR